MPDRSALQTLHPELTRLLRRNPKTDLLQVDLLAEETAPSLDWKGTDRAAALPILKGYQRLSRLIDDLPEPADDERALPPRGGRALGQAAQEKPVVRGIKATIPALAARLLQAGLDSAQRIAALPQRRFLDEHGDLFATLDQAAEVHRRATAVRTAALHLWANVRDLVGSRYFRATRFYNAQDDLVEYFQKIPSYQELFGSLDYLTCAHCRSIFSPAAYFVDIQRVVDECITYPNRVALTALGLRLEDRRPDLFDLPLDCANTDTVIPYLEVVNGVLEKKLAVDLGADPYKTLALAPFPFNLPFQLPLTQIRLQLAELGTSLAEVFENLSSPLAAGAAQAGAAANLQLAADASAADGYYDGMVLRLTQGTGAGQARRVTAYQGATRTAQVEPAWNPAPAAGTLYQVEDPLDVAREGLGLSLEEYRLLTTPQPGEAGVAGAYGFRDGKVPLFGPGQWPAGPGLLTIEEKSTRTAGNAQAEFLKLAPGTLLQCGGKTRTVTEVKSNSELFVEAPWGVSAAGAAYTVNPVGNLERASAFLARTGLTSDQLEELLRQDLSPAEEKADAGNRFFINDTGEGLPPLRLAMDYADPDSPYRRIENLSLARLDRLSRFIRLQAKLGWSAAELSWLILAAGTPEITGRTIEVLAATAGLSRATGLPVDAVAAFWVNVKPIGKVSDTDPQDLFDRTFNNPALLRGQNPYDTGKPPIPFDPARPLAWTVEERAGGGANATIRTRLMAALGVNDDSLTAFARAVLAQQGKTDGVLKLDLGTLSWLYRLARQAAAYRLGADDFLTLLWLLEYPSQPSSLPPKDGIRADLPAAQLVRGYADWLKASPFTAAELQYALTGQPGAGYRPGYTDDSLRLAVNDIATGAKGTLLTPASFVFENIRADEAAALFQSLVTLGYLTPRGVALDLAPEYTPISLLFPLAEGSFLTDDIDAEAAKKVFAQLVEKQLLLPIPGTATASLAESFTAATPLDFLFKDEPDAAARRAEVRGILLQVRRDVDNTRAVLRDGAAQQESSATEGLAAFLAVTPERLLALLHIAAGLTSLASYRADLLTPIPDGGQPSERLRQLVAALWRTQLWAGKLGFTPAQLQAVAATPPAFGIADLRKLTLSDLRTLSRFQELTADLGDSDGVDAVLPSYFRTGDVATIARLTGWNAGQIDRLIRAFWPPAAGAASPGPRSVDGVARLAAAFALAGRTGTDVYFLLDLFGLIHLSLGVIGASAPIEEAWQRYQALAGQTLGVLSARFGEEFAAVWGRVGGELDTARRDALLGYTIWHLQRTFPWLQAPSDLYQFLLLDVEMASCATTSRIAEGIAAVQLYMQRCRLNLETGVERIDVDPTWWDWLSAYRVWEANRKIFLYPESYLMPALRSGQTPEFRQLSESLLQSDLSEGSVTEGFLAYFQGLNELASLVPVGSHNARDPRRAGDGPAERFFLVARTQTSPYTYYWRYSDEATPWSAWEKIDLSINSPWVSPVFAFDKLFLFWTELDTVRSSSITDATAVPQIAVEGTIRYSFLNVTGQWVQPQVLASDIPVEVGPDTYTPYTNGAIKPLFVPDSLFWQQPYPLNLGPGLPGSGRVVITSDLTNVAGKDTFFSREVVPGDKIYCGGETRAVARVVNDTSLLVDRVWTVDAVDAEFKVLPRPVAARAPFFGRGTVVIAEGLTNVAGQGTRFTREFAAGDAIRCKGEIRTVARVVSDTALTVDRDWETDGVGAEYEVIPRSREESSFPSFVGAGKITFSTGVSNVAGVGTSFFKEVRVGSRILAGNEVRTVVRVTSDTALQVHKDWETDVQGQGYIVIPTVSGDERLVVLYGAPFATTLGIDPPAPPVVDNPGRDVFLEQKSEFNDRLFYALKLVQKVAAQKIAQGHVTALPCPGFSSTLNRAESRLVLADYRFSATANPRPYSALLSRGEQMLRVRQSSGSLYDNYWGDSSPRGTELTLPAAPELSLLYNVTSAFSTLLNVGNQPGWFVFDNGDESFLVKPVEEPLGMLSEMVFSRKLTESRGDTEALLLSCGPYSTRPVDFPNLRFAFQRISTSAVTRLYQQLFLGGIDRLLTLSSQETPELPFNRFYQTPSSPPPPAVVPPATDRIDFRGAYGLYFQEIFLFVPWLVADRLRASQRFEEAARWFEYVFNPTAPEDPSAVHPNDRYWRYLPFRSLTRETLQSVLTDARQIRAYNDQPFDPDAIARLRPSAYAKGVVLQYIDNLLQWGDFLFAQDTRESINVATQLYVLAGDLLGPRPTPVGPAPQPPVTTFRKIRAKYGQDIPQFLIDLENSGMVQAPQAELFTGTPINDIRAYFCVPENSELVRYWDLVEDRLFKIRHCMNLQGVERPLALFEPPLDPRQLIRSGATGGGVPLSRFPAAAIPPFRFRAVLERAQSFAGTVAQLGGALLAALEKRDSEALSRLRNSQEQTLLALTTQIKQQQVQEILDLATSLAASREAAVKRKDHYQGLIDADLSEEEKQNLAAMETALKFNLLASITTTASSIGYAVPQAGSPFAMTYGGQQIGAMLQAASGVFQIGSSIATFVAQKSLTMAGYGRRSQDWQLQAELATIDTRSIDGQIAANKVREKIVRRELEIHLETIAQNREIDAFLRRKFTNEQLYDWMASRLAALHFQAWLLALDLARSAQRALQFERNLDQTFLDFVYWDNQRKGLLAGEGLTLALQQMDKAWLDTGARPLEIEKTVSLAQVNPRALLELRATGECTFELSERLFDLDFPGHYCRKIKTVSLSVPALVGPYQSIKATLTQLSNQIVLRPEVKTVEYLLGVTQEVPGAANLRSNGWVNQQIALSTGVNDSGLFQLDFNDERYLPFESTGAVSTWRLSLPLAANRLDFSALSDVVMQLRYTALDGGNAFRRGVTQLPPVREIAGSPLLSFNQQYSQAWFDFLSDHANPAAQTLRFRLWPGVVPPHVQRPELTGFYFVLQLADGVSAAAGSSYLTLALAPGKEVVFSPNPKNAYLHTFANAIPLSEVLANDQTIAFQLAATPKALKDKDGFLDPKVVKNIALVLYYRGTLNWA